MIVQTQGISFLLLLIKCNLLRRIYYNYGVAGKTSSHGSRNLICVFSFDFILEFPLHSNTYMNKLVDMDSVF